MTVEEASDEPPPATNPAHGISTLPQEVSGHPQFSQIEQAIQSTPKGMMHLQNKRIDDANEDQNNKNLLAVLVISIQTSIWQLLSADLLIL